MRALRGMPEDDDRVNSEIHCEAIIQRVWQCTWMPRSSELRDTLGAVIEQVWRCIWRQRSSGLRDAFVGRDRSSLEMHLQTMIERDWRSTWRWSI